LLDNYHFGSEEELNIAGQYRLKTTVISGLKEESMDVFNFQMIDPDTDVVIVDGVHAFDDVVREHSYFYVGDTRFLSGCITGADEIVAVNYVSTDSDFNTTIQEIYPVNDTPCNGENSIDIGLSTNRYRPGVLKPGVYSVIIEAMYKNGIISRSEKYEFEVKNQIASLEQVGSLVVGHSSKFTLSRIPQDKNYHQIVNLPACLRLEIDGETEYVNSSKYESDPENYGYYRVTDTFFFNVSSAGEKKYRVYRQCTSGLEEVELLSGVLTYIN
jgi:hypothetical protein